MATTNNQSRKSAQTLGTVYSKNSTLFSMFKNLKQDHFIVKSQPLNFSICDIDEIDFFEITVKNDTVFVQVLVGGITLYKWSPASVLFDIEGGLCFESFNFVWHVNCLPSFSALRTSDCILTIRCGTHVAFCSLGSSFVELPQHNGTRWMNPSTKSIVMPCDGRGGGIPDIYQSSLRPQMVSLFESPRELSKRLIKRWNYELRKMKNNKKQRTYLKKKISIFEALSEGPFEPQMISSLFDAMPGKALASGISDVAKAIHHCAVQGITVPADVTNRLDEMIGQVSSLNENLNNVAANGVTIKHSHELKLNNFFSWLMEHKETIGILVLCFIVCCLFVSGRFALLWAFCSLISAFLLLADLPTAFKERWDHLCHMMRGYHQGAFKEPTGEWHDAIEPQGIESCVPKALLLFGYLTVFRNLNASIMTDKFESFYKTLSRAPLMTDKFVDILTYYATLCQSLVNTTLKWIGIDKSFNWFGDKYPEATSIIEETEKFLIECGDKSKDLIVNRTAQTSQVLQNQILNMLIKSRTDKDFVGTHKLLTSLQSRLRALDKDLELRGAGRSVTRVAPKAFLFMGKPGIGKSYLLRTLCTMLLYELFSENETAMKRIEAGQTRDFIFTRNSDDKFWEGYYNQTIVYLDEVAMQRDVAGGNAESNEYSSFIKMVNDVCFPLPMANVDKKGTCEFDSDVILGTTNAKCFDIQSINNREAYDRRWIKIEVNVKPEYGYLFGGDKKDENMADSAINTNSTGWYRPDFEKIRKIMSEEDIALSSFLEFKERSSLFRADEYVSGNSMDIHGLISMMRDSIKDREEEKRGNKKHSDILKSIFARKTESRDKTLPGVFEAQSNDCGCKACNLDLTLFFNEAQKFYYQDYLSTPYQTLQSAFEHGMSKVETEKSFLYTDKPACIRAIMEEHPTFESTDLAFAHGAAVKSAYLRQINKPKDEMADYYINLLKMFGTFLGFIIATVGTYKLLKYLFGESNDKSIDDVEKGSLERKTYRDMRDIPKTGCGSTEPEYGFRSNGKGCTPEFHREVEDFFAKHKGREDWNSKCFLEPQVADLNAQEILSSILKRNVYSVGDNVIKHRGFVTFIKDNIFVCPMHYIHNWKRDIASGFLKETVLRRLGDGENHQEIRFDSSIFLRDDLVFKEGETDLCAFYLDNRVMQKHASIRKYLADNKESKAKPNGEMLLPTVKKDSLEYSCLSVDYIRNYPSPMKYTSAGKQMSVDDPIIYRANTQIGDCGLPVAIKNPIIRKEKIFGIHVSGAPSMGVGISHPFTTEFFDSACLYFNKFGLIEAQYRTDAKTVLEMSEEGKSWNDLYAAPEDLAIPGKVNLGYMEPPNMPISTCIIPSPLFKKVGFQPKTKPARLRPFKMGDETIDPNMIATSKYHHSVAAFNLPVLDACKNSVTNIILNNPLNIEDERVGRRVLTFVESVEGIAGVEGLDGIPRKTSAGYPRCKYVQSRGKRDFFGEEGDYEFDNDNAREIELSVNKIISDAEKGIRGNHIFLDFPKDERRPKAKVDAGKTRKISACPIDLAICIRKYFGCFVQFFMANRIYNQSAVGVNVFDKQWEIIADYLGKDNRVIAGDFSNYDGKLPYCVMVRFLDTVTAFYGDRGSATERVREVLFEELVNSRHIMNGVVYEWVGSNASGNPLTTVLNSWCNLVLLRYATLKCVDKMHIKLALPFLRDLDSHIRYMVYGDDNLISVRRDSPFAHYVTQNSLTNVFDEMGLEYTDESKSGGEIDQNRSIYDVSFLKRKWAPNSRSHQRKLLSPLDVNTIMESIQWTKKKDYNLDALKNNVINMIQELSQHEKEVFDEHVPAILAACKSEMNFSPVPNTYEDCQAAILCRDMSF